MHAQPIAYYEFLPFPQHQPVVIQGRNGVLRVQLDKLRLQLFALQHVQRLELQLHADHFGQHQYGPAWRRRWQVVQYRSHLAVASVKKNEWPLIARNRPLCWHLPVTNYYLANLDWITATLSMQFPSLTAALATTYACNGRRALRSRLVSRLILTTVPTSSGLVFAWCFQPGSRTNSIRSRSTVLFRLCYSTSIFHDLMEKFSTNPPSLSSW